MCLSLVLSCGLFLSCFVLSCRVVSCCVFLSCRLSSCLVLFYLVLSCPVLSFLSCLVLYCLWSRHVLSCPWSGLVLPTDDIQAKKEWRMRLTPRQMHRTVVPQRLWRQGGVDTDEFHLQWLGKMSLFMLHRKTIIRMFRG
jgi:hypothetical protein